MKHLGKTDAYGLAALTCFCFSGCGSRSGDLPADAPLIGAPKLLGSNPEMRTTYAVALPLCNRGPGELKGQVRIVGDKQEVLNPLLGFGEPAGSYLYVVVCEAPKKRLHPIQIRVVWQRGSVSSTRNFVVEPKQDDTTR